MPRTPLFRRLLDTMHIAEKGPSDGVDRRRERALGRRQVLKMGAVTAAAISAPTILGGCAAPTDREGAPVGVTRAGLRAVDADVGIVGAGIAGIACAYELRRSGVRATIHEASERIGGRIFSMGGDFGTGGLDWMGQVLERGGELIDTPHKTIIGYAKELRLTLEDVAKPVRDTFYVFDGQRIAESTMVDEYRALVDAFRDDLRRIGSPTAASNTAFERQLDNMSLAEWLATRGAGPNITKLLSVAYCIEYGVEIDRLSCLAFLLFAKGSRQSKLRLWGNFSDERYHVVGGNQQIPVGLAARLEGPIHFGRKLVALKKLTDGRIELTFDEGGRTVTAQHEAVVLTIPFHLLKNVQFDASLELPVWKKNAINGSVYGDNAKLMVGFVGRPWLEQGGSGAGYSNMPNLQATWETNPRVATAERAILTDYTGGALAKSLSPNRTQQHCNAFLDDFNVAFPGAKARARKDSRGNYVCHLEHWPSNPLTKGAYSANQPGYFTTIAGYEGPPVGNLYFAGETTDSFYSWQGFMEGGALSGVRVADEIRRDFG
jgi:monoamine oxidase